IERRPDIHPMRTIGPRAVGRLLPAKSGPSEAGANVGSCCLGWGTHKTTTHPDSLIHSCPQAICLAELAKQVSYDRLVRPAEMGGKIMRPPRLGSGFRCVHGCKTDRVMCALCFDLGAVDRAVRFCQRRDGASSQI